jgi:spermidine synthase
MHNPEMEIDVVDIDAKVLQVAKTYFFLEESPTMRLFAADGRSFIRGAPDAHYDAVILDAFTVGGRIPFHLVTREFFTLCRDKMTSHGAFVMNVNSAVRGPRSNIFRSLYKTLSAVFPQVHVFVVYSRRIPATESTNIILVAAKDRAHLSFEDWEERAAAYESNTYIDQAYMKAMVTNLMATPPDVSDAATFTDDFAPIETMPFD